MTEFSYCPGCGAEITDDASYCQQCGKKLENEISSEEDGNILQTEKEIKEAARDAVEEYDMTREHISEEMVIHYFLMQQIIRKEAEEEVEKEMGKVQNSK